MAIKVIVPNKNFNGKYQGVQFIKGVAVFEDEDKGRLVALRLGYAVEPVEAPVEAEVTEVTEDAVEPAVAEAVAPVETEEPVVAEEPVADKPKRTRRKKVEAEA